MFFKMLDTRLEVFYRIYNAEKVRVWVGTGETVVPEKFPLFRRSKEKYLALLVRPV